MEILKWQIKLRVNCTVTIIANDTRYFMGMTKIFTKLIRLFFCLIFILQTNSALAQKTSSFQGPIFIPPVEAHLPIGLPKLIKELTENYPFEAPYLHKTLEIPFVVITGPVWAPFDKGDGVVNLSDGARIVGITLRHNRQNENAEVNFSVNGYCITQQEVTAQLGNLVPISVDSEAFICVVNRSLSNFSYAKKKEKEKIGIKRIGRGFVKMSFSEESLCLTGFKFRSYLSKYEQKKLEEADMSTPEEIQKKPASKL